MRRNLREQAAAPDHAATRHRINPRSRRTAPCCFAAPSPMQFPCPRPIAPRSHSRDPSRSPINAQADERQVLVDALSDPWDWEAAVSTGEELFFSRPGVPTAALRKLRRGGWVVKGELDLHGHTGDEARVALAAFLNRCMLEDRRCVRIIHGKGHGSKNRLPVLKNKVRHWLMQREDVLAVLPGAHRRWRRRRRHRFTEIIFPLNQAQPRKAQP
ncbi:MAG: Smr/MutS family protein [Candidatus Moduliflexus flocculans]|nr:Smr/MutS family protein [Candidatus Moduliflexus flocculans]